MYPVPHVYLVVQVLATPVVAATAMTIYFDLRLRREGADPGTSPPSPTASVTRWRIPAERPSSAGSGA